MQNGSYVASISSCQCYWFLNLHVSVMDISWNVTRFCIRNSLDKNLVEGKIILCDQLSNGEVVMLAGVVGSIMRYNDPYFEAIGSYPLPVSVVNPDQATNIIRYIRSTR